MKVLIIPDIHQIDTGIDYAKEHIKEVDSVVFLGDIVDNWESEEWWDIPDKNPINVINKLGQFKRENPKKVYWLLGNHDLSYLAWSRENQSVSGHQWHHHEAIAGALRNYIKDIQIAVKLGGWVFSHAGFSDIWKKNMMGFYPILTNGNLIYECTKSFREEAFTTTGAINFNHQSLDGPGDHPSEGPLWIRPNSLLLFSTFKKQVIGHTECGPLLCTVKNEDKVKNKLLIVDSKSHGCFTILDTATDKITIPEDFTLETKELEWIDIKNARKSFKILEKRKNEFYRNFYV